MITITRETPEKGHNQEMRMAIYAKKAAEAERKTVPQILEEIAGQLCDSYCKYPEQWDAEKEGKELIDSDICMNCPLNLF